MKRISRVSLLIFIGLMLASCAKTNPHPMDPLEGINREIYGFNRAVDKGIIRPVAYSYYAYTPKEFQSGVHNFFSNLGTLPTIANDFLQLKFAYAAHDISRFVINSTLGVAGIWDPAHKLGLIKRQEDFGQTLHVWGLKDSIYVVLPLIGPSTVRDTVGMVVDTFFGISPYIDDDHIRYGAKALEIVDLRATLLRNESVLETVGIDEYAFVRDAYLQRRAFASYDGNVPIEEQGTDPFEEDEWLDEDGEFEDGEFEDFEDDEDLLSINEW